MRRRVERYRLGRSASVKNLLPQFNALIYVHRVAPYVRYHRQGRFIWGLTQFENKDFVTLGTENWAETRKEALFYCRWFEVKKWISADEAEPS